MRTTTGEYPMRTETPSCGGDRPVHRSASMLTVIRSEFAEMPGLRLTRPQFRRLWNLTFEEGEPILDCLILTGFLVEGRDGLLRRRVDARR